MQPQQLKSFGEQLLRSGIAPRHVRRYLRELRDHYDDAVQDELKKGASRAASEETAARRLGEPERLLQSALNRPELHSIVARYPRLGFGVGPSLLWIASMVLMFVLLIVGADVALSRDLTWIMAFQYWAMVLFVRILPIALALGVLVMSFRQRLPSLWPIIGAGIVAILAGTLDIHYSSARTVADSSLGISSSLLPFFLDWTWLGPAQPVALVQGLMRAVITLALSVVPFMIWSRRQKLG